MSQRDALRRWVDLALLLLVALAICLAADSWLKALARAAAKLLNVRQA